MTDQAKFILNTTAEYFNSPVPEDSSVWEFLNNEELTILAAVSSSTDGIRYSFEVPQTPEFSLIFYKIPQTGKSRDSGRKIGLLTLEGGMVKSIYNSVFRVFSANSSKQRSEYTPELANIIESLQTSLGNTLGVPDTGISSIENEINYWRKRVSQASTKADKEAAKNFAFSLQKINDKLKQDELSALADVEEFLDFASTAIDEIWRLPYQYPQNRMKGVLDLLSSIIINACVDIASKEEIWDANPIYVYGTMTQAKDIAGLWISQCDTMTKIFWSNLMQSPWIGEPYLPMLAVQFKERVEEIIEIKEIHHQVANLCIYDEDAVSIDCTFLFAPFKEINIYDIGPLGQRRWVAAKKEFDYALTQIDDKIAISLKGLIHNHLNNTRQVVHIFNKYQNVLSRETVQKALVAERENLLSTLPKLFLDLRDTLTQSQLEVGDRSQIVTESKWLKIVERQLVEVQAICEAMLSNLGTYETVNGQLRELLEETQAILKVNFQTWSERCFDAISLGELRLDENAPVVKFKEGDDQLMLVTFNPAFIAFCNDVQEFEALGFRVPEQLINTARQAQKFITYARHLQQIAAFHNTVGDRMVPCQRPIMLQNAMELSRLVKSESCSWSDEGSVVRYIAMLQAAVNKLSHDNNLLTSYHMNAIKIIAKLMDTDLIRQAGNWKDELKNLRDIVGNMERQGYTNLHPFKLHLDHQMYKVLEYQYITGLTDINNKLPDIEIDLIFRQQQLQFRPNIEEIRSKYYYQLRKFIEKPMSFRGLSTQSQTIFRVMVERNQFRFTTLYEAGDEVLKKLETVKETWVPWIALGCVNIDELCTKHLQSWEQWDANFKTCKHFSQQISKLQKTEERLECFVINLSPLRADIEFISRRYWESLTYSLRASILQDMDAIQEYLTDALHVLQHIPLDEQGIINASAKYEKIRSEYPKTAQIIASVQSKDTCLAGWCKERVSALSTLLIQWDQLQPLIENHQSLLQGQLDVIKENLQIQVSKFKEEAEKFSFLWEATLKELEGNDSTNISLYKERQNQWKMIQDKRDHLLSECTKFNVQFPAEVDEVFEKVSVGFKSQSEQWEVYENFLNEYNAVAAEEWAVYRRRPYTFTDLIRKWEGHLAATPVSVSSIRIQNTLSRFRANLPTITMLQSDALIEKHWVKIMAVLGIAPRSYSEIQLSEILSALDRMEQAADELSGIVRQANSEQIVRQAISELEQWGATATVKRTQHVDCRGVSIPIIKEFQEVLNKVGDNQSLLQSAKNSVAFESFSDQAGIWETKLSNLDFVLTSLNQIQRKWIYLEPIFGMGTLKNEEAIFMRIDKDFRYIMREIEHDPGVLSLLKINNIMPIVNSLISQLTRCQSVLTTYIMTKRSAFPRFYFLGDDDLLELLGQSSKEPIIQKHIKKLFPGVYRLGISSTGDNSSFITTIHSAEGDEIRLKSDINIKVPVEVWLNQLVGVIKSTMKDLIAACAKHDEITVNHVKEYPMQVVCLVNSILFTKQTEKAIKSMKLQNHLKYLKNLISHFSSLLQDSSVPGKGSQLLLIKTKALLMDLVYQTTTIEYLLKHNVTSLQDWKWLQQLKFYQNSDQDGIVRVKMVYAEFEYSYEFLGNFNKLVYTSLAHNCYLTLTQAMYLGLGGNPFGPAGTGKTECVKALGALLGRLVFVFNCDENIDTSAMALILSGLARCGAWGCFDEINRLEETTLSAISMLIQPLQQALKEQKKEVCLMEENIQLNPHCCIFVTLNPAGAEYGGRQQLPANLQSLFRPIVMQQPEPKEIARVLLFVEGFKFADQVGDRIVELFDLSQKLLSSQRHYDWGLRELKTVLKGCGKLFKDHEGKPGESEEMEIAVKALRSNVMSKLTTSDGLRFDMLISEVFPNISLTTANDEQLREKLVEAFSVNGLVVNERQISKCLELYEQLQKRMGVVVLGPPDSGKSTIISLLKDALVLLNKTIRTYMISPKSMSRSQLLGHLDPDTRQWRDGVLTTTAIAVNSEPLHITSWICCDGDIDPEWIEALNSVLDDNRLLTLPSGWRIQFGYNVNFIFETHDLSNASPATISRMGIMNLSSEDLNHTLIIESWISKQTRAEELRYLVESYFGKTLMWIEENQKRPDFTTQVGFIKCGLQNSTYLSSPISKDEFCVNFLNGLNAVLDVELRNELANRVFQCADIYVQNPNMAEYCYYNSFRGTVEVYDANELGSFANGGSMEEPMIKTAAVKMNEDVVGAFLRADDRPLFLLVGLSGSGKSLLLQNVVSRFPGYQLITIHCSAQITSTYVAHIIKQNCITVSGIRGKEYKPKFARLILYFKSIELCPVDNWGTSEVIELLLQITNRNGFYSDSLEWISVMGLQICGSMSSVSKHNVSPRFLAKAKYLLFGYPSNVDMQKIVLHLLTPVLDKFKNITTNLNVDQLAVAMINVYSEVSSHFASNQSQHYRFSPKFLQKWIQGLRHYPDDKFDEAIMYECERVFGDRLMESPHLEQFRSIVSSSFRGLRRPEEQLFFVPLEGKSANLEHHTRTQWHEIVTRTVAIANAESKFIDKPVTDELLEVTAAVCRALSRPQTHIALCGRAGSGRNEAVTVATTFLRMKLFSPVPTSIKYDTSDFYNDLRLAIQVAAIENDPVTFVVDHTWVSYARDLLKPIETLLEGSEIPDLFGDDVETVAAPLKGAAQMEGYQDSLVAFFNKRIQTNLHLVLVLESTATDLQDILEQYPVVYQSTELIWVKDPSQSSLQALPKTILDTLEINQAQERIPIPLLFAPMTEIKMFWSDSPERNGKLIKSYFFTHKLMKDKKSVQHDKLKRGVDKILEAQGIVDGLKTEASEKEKAVQEKRKLANQALQMISATMKNANSQKTDLLELKKQTEESSKKLIVRKKAIEEELSLVEPILREASAAVSQIKSEALSEIRSLRAPPETIRDILEGVLRLMGIRDTSWNSMKTFLAKRGVKEDIRSLDPAQINPDNCQAVEKLLKAKADSFDERTAKRASVAAAPLAAWVKANVQYSKVVQSIKPLEREQDELQKNLNAAELEMASLTTGLDDVNAKVKELSEQLNSYTQEAAVLEIQLTEARNTLSSASVLIEKLSNEYSSWSRELQEIDDEIQHLPSKAFMVALCTTHLSHYVLDQRNAFLVKLSKLSNQTFGIEATLLREQEKLIFESMGLTPDQQSMENAALLLHSLQMPFGSAPVPLLLDPSGQCLKWLVAHLKASERAHEVMSQSADRFVYKLELAVRFGKILVIEEGASVGPALFNLVLHRTFNRFAKKMVQIGGKLVDLHDDFKLILATSAKSANLQGDLHAHISALAFTITPSGFTDQLMSKWILLKKPALEQQRVELLKKESEMLQSKIKLQDQLLEELSAAQGNILKNEQLLLTLNGIKTSSASIETSLQQSMQVRNTMMEEYNSFKPICSNSAAFYVSISRIYNLKPSSFIHLFLHAADSDESLSHTEVAVTMYKKLVRQTYITLSRSVARKDQIALGLNICKHAYPDSVPEKEWELFVFNFMTSDNLVDESVPNWIPAEAMPKILSLKSQAPAFYANLQLSDAHLWRPYLDSHRAVDIPVKITEFQRILVAQVFRPDLLVPTILSSVAKILEIKSLANVSATLRQLVEESKPDEPILIVAGSGTDPSAEIKDLAARGQRQYVELSIGRGQESYTLAQVKEAAESGKWICIKNVHLAPNWLTSLNEEFKIAHLKEGFRFFMVCDSDAGFSPSFVSSCLKIVFESPPGLKNKIRGLFEQHLDLLQSRRDYKYLKPVVALLMLHAIIQERSAYIPQGWCKWYDFGEADLKAALAFVTLIFSTNASSMDWPVLRGLSKKIAYGGRVDYQQDFQKLEELLSELLNVDIMNNRWSPLNFPIVLSNSSNFQEYLSTINGLPEEENPALIGLSSATNISKDIIFCRNLLKDLRSKYFNVEEGQTYEKRIKPILNLWRKLVSTTTVMKTSESLRDDSSCDPWTIFKLSELVTAGKLFNAIHRTLSRIHSVMRDSNALLKLDIQLMKCLGENQVPLEWKALWHGPKLATDYIKHVVHRGVEAEKRYRTKDHLDGEINLTDMFNVKTFLATFKLIRSKDLGVSTNNLHLTTSFGDTKKSSSSILVSPLRIDGGFFKNRKLCVTEGEPRTCTFEMNFTPSPGSSTVPSNDVCDIPLYTNLLREDLICNIQTHVSSSRTEVVFSGVAFIIPEFQ